MAILCWAAKNSLRGTQTIPCSTSHHILTYDSEMIFIFPLLQNDYHFRGGSYPVFTTDLQFSVPLSCRNFIQNNIILCSKL
jgi:hypothetical protein